MEAGFVLEAGFQNQECTKEMTEKRGNWLKDAAKLKEENDKLKKVLKEIYVMCGMYYASTDEVRNKIKADTGIDDK